MGAAQSIDDAGLPATDGAENTSSTNRPKGTTLYKFSVAPGGGGGQWALESANASWSFYNANESSSSKTAWYLEIESANVDILVCEAVELQIDLTACTATFYDAEQAAVCKMLFSSQDACVQFSDTYHNKLYENIQSQGGAELGNAGDWFFRSADVEPMDWEDSKEEPEEPAAPVTPRLWKQSEAMDDAARPVQGVAMGAGENSFLVQDSRISVLRNGYGAVTPTGRAFELTPPPATGLGAEAPSFTPSKVMLMKGETEMNMLTSVKKDVVAQADLNSGAVVREWKCKLNGVDIPMADITQDTRDAQLDHRSTFLGLDANRLCRWDQRTAAGVVQELSYRHGKDYARNTNFTCMATSGEGYIAVGSKDGRIRLYGSRKGMDSYEFKAAVTSVPGLGLPITAIDVSFDGRYVVGTTDKYLIVIQTAFKDAKGAETTGFVSRMGSNTPPPKLLKLSPEDRVKVGVSAKFGKGRLTWITSDDMTERWIAASCGMYTILWNFRRVKSMRPTVISSGAFTICSDYSMIKKDEKVVDNAFLHDKYAVTPQAKNALLVATEHHLYNCVDEDSDFE